VTDLRSDPITAFYDRHPYPPPVRDLDHLVARVVDGSERRVAHHLIWPERPIDTVTSVLVAGCGTSQAARHALRRPDARVVGIDVSAASIAHTRRLAERHRLDNLTVHRLPIERVDELGERFDHVVCTGVLHHLADPTVGLRCLRDVLAPGGAITLMVYAPYGRTGVYLMQDHCHRLGVTTSPDDLADLVATLRELPLGHPLSRLLREARDFVDDGALADTLLNPRDRAYAVPALFELLDGAGLRFGRWSRQAPYLHDCGAISETPHAARIANLPEVEQYAALELFRGTITRHTLIAFDANDPTSVGWTSPTPVLRLGDRSGCPPRWRSRSACRPARRPRS
jgi:SAM-dependent methyltransferase